MHGYSTNKYVDVKIILDFARDDDNTEDKLHELFDKFTDYVVDWAEANNAHVGMLFADITSEAEQYGHFIQDDDDDDDAFSTGGRLMTDEDYDDLEDEDEEEEEVVSFWRED
jgi:hypothetical protein